VLRGTTVGRAHADEAGGELVEIGLANDEGAGSSQARHRGRIVGRVEAESRTGRRGRQAGDVDIVLDREGHAVERQIFVARGFERLGLGQHLGFVAQGDEQRRIGVGADAGKSPGDGLRRGHGAGPVRCHDVEDGLSHGSAPLSNF